MAIWPILVFMLIACTGAAAILIVRRRERALIAAFTARLLERIATHAKDGTIEEVSFHASGPSLRRVVLSADGISYTVSFPESWRDGDPDDARPLRFIRGTVDDARDKRMRRDIFLDPLWGDRDIVAIAFSFGEDPVSDASVRKRHGIIYELSAREREGRTMRKDGILPRAVVAHSTHDASFETIIRAARERITTYGDSEGGTL